MISTFAGLTSKACRQNLVTLHDHCPDKRMRFPVFGDAFLRQFNRHETESLVRMLNGLRSLLWNLFFTCVGQEDIDEKFSPYGVAIPFEMSIRNGNLEHTGLQRVRRGEQRVVIKSLTAAEEVQKLRVVGWGLCQLRVETSLRQLFVNQHRLGFEIILPIMVVTYTAKTL